MALFEERKLAILNPQTITFERRKPPMQSPTFLVTELLDAPREPRPDDRIDPLRAALVKAGTLLVDLADHTSKLAGFVAEHPAARALAGSLGRRAELALQLGRRLALFSDSRAAATTTIANDAILALDGVAVDVEYAAELGGDVKIKNQVARARLAVTTAGCAIDDARRVIAARS